MNPDDHAAAFCIGERDEGDCEILRGDPHGLALEPLILGQLQHERAGLLDRCVERPVNIV